jgi:hypothetical protein
MVRISDKIKETLDKMDGKTYAEKIERLLSNNSWPDWVVKDAENVAAFDKCTFDEALYKVTHNIPEQETRMSTDPFFDDWDYVFTDESHDLREEPYALRKLGYGIWGNMSYGNPEAVYTIIRRQRVEQEVEQEVEHGEA